ncbi:MAG: DUF488 family protein [Gammaproteobacteria bacterium]|nr:DUF488 family protein [Gammaproteobacteria bacterium]
MTTGERIRCRRVYDAPRAGDGQRVLVERLWPRGLKSTDVDVVLWLKDIAPSTALRRWYGHDPARWPEFRQRYRSELSACPEAVTQLLELADRDVVTLVYAARDIPGNGAQVLRDYLLARLAVR